MSTNPADGPASDDDTHRTEYDHSDADGVSTAVASATAALAGTSPVRLDPLYETIDPDALEAFVRSADGSASLEFDYHGYRVVVSGDGNVVVSQGL